MSKTFRLVSGFIIVLYFIFVALTAKFFTNSDVSTILIPIIFYVLMNIILRNSKQDNGNLRLQDFNDSALIGYAITYIALQNDKISSFFYKIFRLNIEKDWRFTTLLIVLGVLITLLVVNIILPFLSTWLNKESYYRKDKK